LNSVADEEVVGEEEEGAAEGTKGRGDKKEELSRSCPA